MRPIDADNLTKELGINDMDCEKCKWGHKKDLGYDCGRGGDFKDACFAIEHAPTIEPETPWRKEGMWIKTGQSFVFPEKFRNYSCSECGYDVDKIKFNFCPNCGADMDIKR